MVNLIEFLIKVSALYCALSYLFSYVFSISSNDSLRSLYIKSQSYSILGIIFSNNYLTTSLL